MSRLFFHAIRRSPSSQKRAQQASLGTMTDSLAKGLRKRSVRAAPAAGDPAGDQRAAGVSMSVGGGGVHVFSAAQVGALGAGAGAQAPRPGTIIATIVDVILVSLNSHAPPLHRWAALS